MTGSKGGSRQNNADALAKMASGGEASDPAAEDSGRVFQSIVLVTRGRPALDVEKVKQRLAKWLGVSFPAGGDEMDNFIVGEDARYMVKLRSTSMFMITLLPCPYFEGEDVSMYQLEDALRERGGFIEGLCKLPGAIVIDALLGPVADRLVLLAKLAAACISADTKFMVCPASFKAEKITEDLARQLVTAKSPGELLTPLCNFLPLAKDGKIFYRTFGMSMLGLPDVAAVSEDDQEQIERTMTAVQSTAVYQVSLGRSLPHGDTCTMPGCGTYRIVWPSEDDSLPYIFLEPEP